MGARWTHLSRTEQQHVAKHNTSPEAGLRLLQVTL